jgi:hypothetical protein
LSVPILRPDLNLSYHLLSVLSSKGYVKLDFSVDSVVHARFPDRSLLYPLSLHLHGVCDHLASQ